MLLLLFCVMTARPAVFLFFSVRKALRRLYNSTLPVEIAYNGDREVDAVTRRTLSDSFAPLYWLDLASKPYPAHHNRWVLSTTHSHEWCAAAPCTTHNSQFILRCAVASFLQRPQHSAHVCLCVVQVLQVGKLREQNLCPLPQPLPAGASLISCM